MGGGEENAEWRMQPQALEIEQRQGDVAQRIDAELIDLLRREVAREAVLNCAPQNHLLYPEKRKMGRGDRKTRKGKISIRSYGNARPHKATAKTGAVKKAAAPKVAVKKAAPAAKKAAPKKSA